MSSNLKFHEDNTNPYISYKNVKSSGGSPLVNWLSSFSIFSNPASARIFLFFIIIIMMVVTATMIIDMTPENSPTSPLAMPTLDY